MTEQTEAQRLADRLDLYATGDDHQRDIDQAAEELRRLDAENTDIKQALAVMESVAEERNRLEAGCERQKKLLHAQSARITALEQSNAELVEALGRLMNHVVGMQSCTRDLARARAAIAKHGGQQ